MIMAVRWLVLVTFIFANNVKYAAFNVSLVNKNILERQFCIHIVVSIADKHIKIEHIVFIIGVQLSSGKYTYKNRML